MFELLNELNVALTEAGIPFAVRNSGGSRKFYYPTTTGYKYCVKQFMEDEDKISLYSSGNVWVADYYNIQEVFDVLQKHHAYTQSDEHYIDEEIGRLVHFNRQCSHLSEAARNLNLLALQGKLSRAYGRQTEAEQIMRIMLRKTKPNALLVGQAGCGKTAIVEELAFIINDARLAYIKAKEQKKEDIEIPLFLDTIIYDLDISAFTANTKYRGEFEEKVRNIITETRNNPNIILFIDEVHQLNTIGSAEGTSGMGQLLKPALARGDVHCIGATTDDELRHITEDKALARRFNRVRVLPLVGAVALNACEKIAKDYEAYHKVAISNSVDISTLFQLSQSKLKATAFPDNFINLIDETLATARFNGLTEVGMADFEATITELVGAEIVSVKFGFC